MLLTVVICYFYYLHVKFFLTLLLKYVHEGYDELHCKNGIRRTCFTKKEFTFWKKNLCMTLNLKESEMQLWKYFNIRMPETLYQHVSRKYFQNADGYSVACNKLCWLSSVRGTCLVLHVSRTGPSLAHHRRKACLLQATSCQKWTTCQYVGEVNSAVEQEIQRTSLFFDSGRNQIRF